MYVGSFPLCQNSSMYSYGSGQVDKTLVGLWSQGRCSSWQIAKASRAFLLPLNGQSCNTWVTRVCQKGVPKG